MKIACLWVPELSLVAALRAEPQLCTEPLAVVQAGRDLGVRAHVLGATGAAQGVTTGQTLAEARAICPRRREQIGGAARRPGRVGRPDGGGDAVGGRGRSIPRRLARRAARIPRRATPGCAGAAR